MAALRDLVRQPILSLNEVMGRDTWPPPALRRTWEEVELMAAFRVSDETRLRQEASVRWNQPYMLSPLPRLISKSKGNLLFGEAPDFVPADEADQERLEELEEANGMEGELMRGALIASSEGDAWGRVVMAPALLDYPIIEFVSRRRVIPHFSGRFLQGATFISEWATSATERFRLFETYGPGYVTNRLFHGSRNTLGTEVGLDTFDETRGTPPAVETGIPRPLVVFIPNSIDADPCRGFSDYKGMEARFLAINEAGTVGQQNLRLAGRKRALVDGDYINPGGGFDDRDDVLIRKAKDATMGDQAKPLAILEYSFEAQATVAWIDHMLDTTLLLGGTSPQAVGRGVEGGAISGTALRLKMAHSLVEASGAGRYWKRSVGELLRFCAILDARPTSQGGYGRPWKQADGQHTMVLQDGLPRDDLEAAQILTALVNAEAMSLEERVRFAHPDWSDQQVTDEVDRINKEKAASSPAAPASIEVPRPAITLGPPEAPTGQPPDNAIPATAGPAGA